MEELRRVDSKGGGVPLHYQDWCRWIDRHGPRITANRSLYSPPTFSFVHDDERGVRRTAVESIPNESVVCVYTRDVYNYLNYFDVWFRPLDSTHFQQIISFPSSSQVNDMKFFFLFFFRAKCRGWTSTAGRINQQRPSRILNFTRKRENITKKFINDDRCVCNLWMLYNYERNKNYILKKDQMHRAEKNESSLLHCGHYISCL